MSSLRAAWPHTRIDWLVQDEFADVVSAHPALDSVVRFPRSRFRGSLRSPGRALSALRWAASLRKGGWELAIDCQGLARSAFFARCSRAGRRVGFADARELGWIHYNQRVAVTAPHAVDRMMALVDALELPRVMDMRLYVPSDDQGWLREHSASPRGRYAVFAPRSRWAAKEWPEERWSELALNSGALDIEELILVGSPSEAPSIERLAQVIELERERRGITNAPRVRVFAGRTSVGQLMAIIGNSSLVVSCDSAALHMAVGFARPLVALYGPTDPAEVGPWGYDSAVLRDPSASGSGHDYRRGKEPAPSMLALSVDQVLERMAIAVDRESP
ncbi:MAG: glycosyltransferase family 9 protein [Phycisphaerales bacterium]|nr:glycosyltransferase family 9 protein [Phycisphaerales bacterium]